MKKLIGVVASCRKIGNGEIVVKSIAERLAPRWKLSLVRLSDCELRLAKGAIVCLLPGRLQDSKTTWPGCWNAFKESDGIIFSSPNYVLGPVGLVKMLADRAFPSPQVFRSISAEKGRGCADPGIGGVSGICGYRAGQPGRQPWV